jgi:hypothetical protein
MGCKLFHKVRDGSAPLLGRCDYPDRLLPKSVTKVHFISDAICVGCPVMKPIRKEKK